MVARYGGEEILIILPNTSDKDAIILAERLRQTIESTPLENYGEVTNDRAIHTTVSIGLASNINGFNEASELLVKADEALYNAKEEGRNRVVAFNNHK
jgi:two-component system cell cycle response regulator